MSKVKTVGQSAATVLGQIAGSVAVPAEVVPQSLSVFRVGSHTSFRELLPKSILVNQAGQRLVRQAEIGRWYNESSQEIEQIYYDETHDGQPGREFAVDGDGFKLGEVRYHLERYGMADDESDLASSANDFELYNERERAVFEEVLSVAKGKGEILAKVRDKMVASHWRDYCTLTLGVPVPTASVYMRIATNFDSIAPSTKTIADALKQISAEKKTDKSDGPKTEKPRLAEWEQSVVDLGKEFKVRGSAPNLIRFLLKFGVSEEQIRGVVTK